MIKRLLLTSVIVLWSATAIAQWQVPSGAIPVGRGAGVTGFNTVLGSGGAGAKCLLDTTPPTFGTCAAGAAAGANTQVQYNNAGLLGGITGATSNGTTLTLVAPILGTPASGIMTNVTGLPIGTGVSGLGTGIATALGVNIGTAGSPVINGGALGTPSSGVATNLTGTAAGLTAGNVTTNANLTGPITSAGNATSIASQTGTGTKFVVDNTPTLITPVIGAATGTSLAATGALSSSGTAGIGYATGAGGTVTQVTSRTNPVTLNKTSGAITMFSAAGSATAATFTVTNSTVAATDTMILNQKSGTNLYNFLVSSVSAGSFTITFFTTGGTATDSPVINFNVIKGVSS